MLFTALRHDHVAHRPHVALKPFFSVAYVMLVIVPTAVVINNNMPPFRKVKKTI